MPTLAVEDLPARLARVAARGRHILGPLVVGLVAFLVLGNAAIVVTSTWYRSQPSSAGEPEVSSIKNFRVVDDRVWRGAAPHGDGLRELADAGVTTIVDLRAEDDLGVDADLLAELGVERVHLPIRDGQLPSRAQIDEFLDVVRGAPGTVFVHCGAGVGRTGAMVAVYLTTTGQASGLDAARLNLSVGPPSLEQIAFASRLDGSGYERPSPLITGMSRVLDAPRRIWHSLT